MPVLFRDDVFLEHETGAHPESPDRLRAVHAYLDERADLSAWEIHSPDPVSLEVLRTVHTGDHIARIRNMAEAGGGRVESDTIVSPRSYDVALRATGAAVQAVDCVLGDEPEVAVALTRPPGHHALVGAPMGFCLFNNVAVAARYALDRYGLSRVLIVDWDVHHGNGTQDIFYDSADVWFFSVHRWPFYPGTGAGEETGTGAGLGATFNLPLDYGVSRADYFEQFHSMLADAAQRCRPELLLLSAGFDAHAADPIGSLGLESEDFHRLTRLACEVGNEYCRGRIVSLLEGGYNVDALAESVACHLNALADPA